MKDLVLYERYHDSKGELRLRHGKQLYYDTGDPVERPHFFKFRNIDWNGDGSIDFIGCNESGFFVLFRNAVLTAEKPRVYLGMPHGQDYTD